MGFIESANIQVFPCGRRSSEYDTTARLTTEYNLVSIINRLVDKESFIVTDVSFDSGKITESNKTQTFSFNIGGYLFTTTPKNIIDAADNASNSSKFIIAKIKPEPTNDAQRLVELSPIDANSTEVATEGYTFLDQINDKGAVTFVGVKFSFENSIPKDSDYIMLPLFEKRNDDWYFVEDSKIKFETNQEGTHRSVRIDDGILDN